MQWKCVYDSAKESGDEGGRSCEDSDVERLGGREFKVASKTLKDKVGTSSTDSENPQWMANIAPPSDLLSDDPSPPLVKGVLDFVHGTRIADCRQMLSYNEDGNVIFASAACCIVYDRDKHNQHISSADKGAVLCLDVSPSGKVGAAGCSGANPDLYFWDARTSKRLGRHNGLHKNGISSLKFSLDSSLLITLGQDEMSSVVLLKSNTKRWDDSFVLASSGVSFSRMFWVLYADGNDYPIIVGGNRCLFFLRVGGKGMERSRGVFGRRRKLQPILCGIVADETNAGGGTRAILTGTVTGHVYQWVGKSVNTVISAHDSPVTSISRCRGGYATGGKDGLIKLWTKDLKLLYTYNTQSFESRPLMPSCHSLYTNSINSRLLIG
jgi:WD40 repeat protein